MPDNPLVNTNKPINIAELGEYWQLTSELRYRCIVRNGWTSTQLEQLWRGSRGGQRWEVVPTVNEDGTPAQINKE